MNDRLTRFLSIDGFAVLLAFITCCWFLWTDYGRLYPDGTSYLDMADAFRRGDWKTAANATWGPGLAMLCALALTVSRASRENDFLALSAVFAALTFITLYGSRYFCLSMNRLSAGSSTDNKNAKLLIYAATTVSIWLINPVRLTPDLALLAITIFAGAEILNWLAHPNLAAAHAWRLGLLAGAGFIFRQSYLVPSAILFLYVVLLCWRSKQYWHVIRYSIGFLLLVAPWTLFLSVQRQRFTFGDNGRWNYVNLVNRVDNYFWQDVPPRFGTPKHPPLLLDANVKTFLYRSHFDRVSLPMHYDLAWWSDGERPQIDPPAMLRQLKINLGVMQGFFRHKAPFLLFLIALSLLFATVSKHFDRQLFSAAILLATPTFVYCAVHIEARQSIPFICVPFCLLVVMARRHLASVKIHLGSAAALTILLAGAYDVYRNLDRGHDFLARALEMSTKLRQVNFPLHAEVAAVHPVAAFPLYCLPRYAQFRVTAIVPHVEEYFRLSDEEFTKHCDLLRKNGIRAVMTRSTHPEQLPPGRFQHLIEHFYVHYL